MNKKVKTYKPTIILRTLYKLIKNNIIKITNKKRIFEFLNKFLRGVNITKIKPINVLIKNLG